MNWQPIETAPKDGRPVWCRETNWPHPNFESIVNCYWAYWNDGAWRLAGKKAKPVYPDECMEARHV